MFAVDIEATVMEVDGKRKNLVATKGYSYRAGKSKDRPKRKRGDPPTITQKGMSDTTFAICKKALPYMTHQVLTKYNFALRDKFSSEILDGNYFEAVAAAVTRGADVALHV